MQHTFSVAEGDGHSYQNIFYKTYIMCHFSEISILIMQCISKTCLAKVTEVDLYKIKVPRK